jgi:hypothetical protein
VKLSKLGFFAVEFQNLAHEAYWFEAIFSIMIWHTIGVYEIQNHVFVLWGIWGWVCVSRPAAHQNTKLQSPESHAQSGIFRVFGPQILPKLWECQQWLCVQPHSESTETVQSDMPHSESKIKIVKKLHSKYCSSPVLLS